MALFTNKALGQHWLKDQRVISRIVSTLGVDPARRVVEIGPGTGALTKALLEAGATVYAIEMDSRCWPILEELGRAHPGRFMLIPGDALQVDWDGLLCGGKADVVGNLPYNVGTEIVAKLVTWPTPPRSMVFMLQKEVIRRICAQPHVPEDRADWGRLAVLCDQYCERWDVFDVPPGAFAPPPQVMSSVARLVPRRTPDGTPKPLCEVPLPQLETLLRIVFGQRRKMLRSVLKGHLTEADMTAVGIDPTHRAEVLDTIQLCALAQKL